MQPGIANAQVPPVYLHCQNTVQRHRRADCGGAAVEWQNDNVSYRKESGRPAHRDYGGLVPYPQLLAKRRAGCRSGPSAIRPSHLTLYSCCTDGKTMDYAEVSNTFVRLADTHFVQRCPLVPATENSDPGPPPPAPTLVVNEKDMYLVPKLSLIGKEF